ncbi:hypothetical protein ACG7TL_008817 [Trametes sanguinea]
MHRVMALQVVELQEDVACKGCVERNYDGLAIHEHGDTADSLGTYHQFQRKAETYVLPIKDGVIPQGPKMVAQAVDNMAITFQNSGAPHPSVRQKRAITEDVNAC